MPALELALSMCILCTDITEHCLQPELAFMGKTFYGIESADHGPDARSGGRQV